MLLKAHEGCLVETRNRIDRGLAVAGLVVAVGSVGLWISSLFWTPDDIGVAPHPLDYLTVALWGVSLVLIIGVLARYAMAGGGRRGQGWIITGMVLAGLFLMLSVLISIDPVLSGGIEKAFNDIQSAPPLIPIGLGLCSVGLLRNVHED